MQGNAKNRLKELLESLGMRIEDATFHRLPHATDGWQSTVSIHVPGLPIATGTGTGRKVCTGPA